MLVAASRPARHLAPAADLADRLGCELVALCSGRARPAEFAVLAAEWPGLRWTAVDVPAGYRHPLLDFATSAIEDVKALRLGDLSVKRNLGLLLARLAGWTSLLFLDDDIDRVDPAKVRRGTAALDRWAAVGFTVGDYPDNSVVCHANRLAGSRQDVFVGGSALLVRGAAAGSFFPDVYNEDWLFLFDSLADRNVASCGSVRQLPYQPFADPGRAAAEEFGDVIAEGLVSLLHNPSTLADATDAAYWRRFLLHRRDFIERAASRISAIGSAADHRAALLSLQAAEDRRAAITPESCAAYVRTWRNDRSAWARRLAELGCLGTSSAALLRLDLQRCTVFSDLETAARKDTEMTAVPVRKEVRANQVGAVLIDQTARIAVTAQIGAPYRRLRHGEWERLDRPTTIGANCDVGHFCVVGEEAYIGDGSILDSFTLVAAGVTIGAKVIVTHRASVDAKAQIGGDCVIGGLIGERSKVGNGCRVFGDLIHRQLDPTRPWDASESMESSPILEEGVFIGWGATVVGGITISHGAYVCAGATVTKDVPPGHIVTGINKVHTPKEWHGALGKSEFFRTQAPKVVSATRI